MTTCALVGATYFNEQDFMARYNEGFFDFIIAVDGGFAPLDRLGVAPDMAIGDFDSLGYVPRAKRVSRHPVNKDASDMELALQRAANYRHTDIYVYGGIGGRLDHTLANLQLFAAYSERGFYVTGIAEGFAAALPVPMCSPFPITWRRAPSRSSRQTIAPRASSSVGWSIRLTTSPSPIEPASAFPTS